MSTKILAFSLNKMVYSIRFEFSFDFPLFFMFMLSTRYDVWLYRCMTVVLFISFCVDDLDNRAVLIKLISHIKFMLVSMLHQMCRS